MFGQVGACCHGRFRALVTLVIRRSSRAVSARQSPFTPTKVRGAEQCRWPRAVLTDLLADGVAQEPRSARSGRKRSGGVAVRQECGHTHLPCITGGREGFPQRGHVDRVRSQAPGPATGATPVPCLTVCLLVSSVDALHALRVMAGHSVRRGSAVHPNTRLGAAQKLANKGQARRDAWLHALSCDSQRNACSDSQERFRAPADVLCLSWNPTRYDENKVRAARADGCSIPAQHRQENCFGFVLFSYWQSAPLRTLTCTSSTRNGGSGE